MDSKMVMCAQLTRSALSALEPRTAIGDFKINDGTRAVPFYLINVVKLYVVSYIARYVYNLL